MKTDLLADRHIGIQEADLPAMLEKINLFSWFNNRFIFLISYLLSTGHSESVFRYSE